MLDSFYTAFIEEQRYLLYLDGLKMTILVSVIAIIIGVVLGTLLALMRLTAEQKGKSTLLSKIAYVYIDIIRAGIQAVDQGQMEGGRALGLSYVQTMKDIILPQAIKNILPALGNEFIVLVKETSILGYVAIVDLTKVSDFVISRIFEALAPLLGTALSS